MTVNPLAAAVRFGLRWATSAFLAAASLAVTAGTTVVSKQSSELRFDQVFQENGEPAFLHYQAIYRAPRGPHTLEVWRDGERHLVRRTDDTIETHVDHRPGDPSFLMVVLDLKRKIETQISRDDLFRIGQFTEWFDLAHGLRYPRGAYRLTTSVVPAQSPKSIKPCSWYALDQDGRTTSVCWSKAEHMPLLLLDGTGQVLWQVTSVDLKPVAAPVFEIHDIGFVRNDADRDISND